MATLLPIHRQTPQPRRLRRAAEAMAAGQVVAYPTDSSYALGCALGDRAAKERIQQLRGLRSDHLFTLICRDLSEISKYARVENRNFRLLKAATPGAYTFVLPATKEVPNWLAQPKRKTIGIRVPDDAVARGLADALGTSFMSVSAEWQDDGGVMATADDVRDAFGGSVDMILDGGPAHLDGTTIVDLTGDLPQVDRTGIGALAPLGLE
ncbi:threonylcarbamoyl-AMP synthase [Salinisphaera sp. USBA-960]|uniref:L-threonylcarbamoyladenylate synthase n=1 Tax=Salinisphaera orenii TaxID=856731 RepID=UPI000DBE88FF|nr:threonylcarbamoyl-AMP synthase [Salifodinibacter halophilus]NNC25641.1 threonylcarbamoyl-AMP synthase [Salifodinibacter halophilus]